MPDAVSKRLLRGMLPLAVALAATPGCLLPAVAGAAPLTSMPVAATPDRATEWWLTALGVPRAWQATGVKPPGAGVTVAVLSTGVDATHPDLTGVVTPGPDYSGSGAGPKDQFWGVEGTAVASLIAGHGHGRGDASGMAGLQGITGIAPGAKVLSLRVTLEYNDARNAEPAITRHLADAIAAGIRYAVAHGASVIALPLDPGTLGPVMTGDPVAAGGSPRERAAVSEALAHGVALIGPAGDNGASTGIITYPAAYPGVLAVGATDQAGNLELYSNRGAFVGLTAPGSGLTVAAPGGGYITIKTTDMAAALTAGVAALIRAKYPRLSSAQVNHAITHGSGSLNAAGAIQAAAAIAARLPRATPSSAKGTASPSAPAAPLANPSASNAAAPQGSADSTAGSVVRDAAIGAGALIALLIVALLATHARQRRMRAARARHGSRPQETAPAGHSARAGTGGFPAAITGGFPALSSHGAHAAQRGSVTGPRGTDGQPDGAPLPGRIRPPATSQARPVSGLASRPGSPARSGHGHASPGPAGPGAANGGSPRPAPRRLSGPRHTGPLHAAPRGAPTPRSDGVPRPRPLPPARDDGIPPWQPAQAPEEAVPPLPAPSAGPQLGTSSMPGIVNQADFATQPATLSQSGTGSQAGPVAQAGSVSQAGTAGQPASGPAGSAQDRLALPPWSRLPDELAAATAPADLPDWTRGTGSGPMYIWNPATNSGPFPVLNPEDELPASPPIRTRVPGSPRNASRTRPGARAQAHDPTGA
jgi:Subtilase family